MSDDRFPIELFDDLPATPDALLLRLAHDVEVLSTRQHAFIVEHHEELGRMIGGWLRYASRGGRGEPA